MVHALSPAARTRDFLAAASQFHLGELPTEQPHPLTGDLSHLAVDDLPAALRLLHRIDREALRVLAANCGRIGTLAKSVAATLASGNDVHLCGCGATGRLSLACETLWRRAHPDDGLADRVRGFMAGGDVALVRSIENFEDHPDLGQRQLLAAGFRAGDLLVSCTEGGETPFVIGATLLAAKLSPVRPFFLYCNTDDVLGRVAERSARVIRDPRIEKIPLCTGPMALAGSTRMQASTVLMAAVGLALQHQAGPAEISASLAALTTYWDGLDPACLAPFIERESAAVRTGGRVRYRTGTEYAISVLTDTTERSPTFSLPPFANSAETGAVQSPCHLQLQAADSDTAWQMILGRAPRTLEWTEIHGIASRERLLGFDFSAAGDGAHTFAIHGRPESISLDLDGQTHELGVAGLSPLLRHLVLKMLLNMHSTLVMGRLGRYDGNIMTWVRPANNKLIDRAIRYADLLLRRRGVEASYEALALACFEAMEAAPPHTSLVHAMVEKICSRS